MPLDVRVSGKDGWNGTKLEEMEPSDPYGTLCVDLASIKGSSPVRLPAESDRSKQKEMTGKSTLLVLIASFCLAEWCHGVTCTAQLTPGILMPSATVTYRGNFPVDRFASGRSHFLGQLSKNL
ncbi:UNVERIFIED_CONTAM: hypothetical protein K2H54_043214 [Gekko kuhli]